MNIPGRFNNKRNRWKGGQEARVFPTSLSDNSLGIIIAFNESNEDLMVGHERKNGAFNPFKNENYLGSKKCMLKWSNKAINK